MFKKAAIILIPLFLLFAASSIADVTKEDIAKAIDFGKLKHPYLYFTEADKAAIKERAQKDPDFGGIMDRALAEANRYWYAPVSQIIPERSKNPRYDLNYAYENYLSDYSQAAYILAFAYQMTGEVKYAVKAFEYTDAVCDLPTWVHTAHEFNVIYDRVWPWGAKDDEVVFSYMQWTDTQVLKIAAVYDWIYPSLDKRQRDRIRGAILEKAILRVRGNYEYQWWASAYRCNWCAVLNSSLGVASAALLTEDPNLTDVVAESYNRVGKVFNEIKGGGWAEGVSYMSYCMTEGLELGTVLDKLTGGKYNLYKNPEIGNAVKTFVYCAFPPNMSVHVGDSGNGNIGSYRLYNRLMLQTNDPAASWLRKRMSNDMPSEISDLFLPKSDLKPELPKQGSIHFSSVDWVIMRSDFTDMNKVSVFAKSGMNEDPHHGHLDQGHFSLYWHGQEIICDNGSAGYDKDYFDNERWNHPLANTGGHNCIIVNGEMQMCAKTKNEPWKEGIGGKVILFKAGNDRDYAILDPSKAYPGKELKGWRRHITLDKPEITVIVDEVKSAVGAEIEARFHSPAAIKVFGKSGTDDNAMSVKENFTILNGAKGKMAVIPVADKATIREGRHAILMAQSNAQFNWVPYFGTVVKAESDKTVIGTIILPVADEKEASAIAGSLKKSNDGSGLTISFDKNGKTFTYKYKNSPDGLVGE